VMEQDAGTDGLYITLLTYALDLNVCLLTFLTCFAFASGLSRYTS